MTTLQIIGRRWFQRSAGNTYHTVAIYIDGNLVHSSPVTYGYGNHWEQTATEWLAGNGHLPGRDGSENLRIYCERNGIEYLRSVQDVSRKRDL